jgi:hypothetical protein
MALVDLMGSVPAELFVHTMTIEPYTGQDGQGQDLYGAPVEVRCFVDAKRRRVRSPATSNATGDEVLSEATAYAALATVAPPNSRVTLPDGTVSRVIASLRRDGGSLPVPSHLEIVIA